MSTLEGASAPSGAYEPYIQTSAGLEPVTPLDQPAASPEAILLMHTRAPVTPIEALRRLAELNETIDNFWALNGEARTD
jgi:hypothetical protein